MHFGNQLVLHRIVEYCQWQEVSICCFIIASISLLILLPSLLISSHGFQLRDLLYVLQPLELTLLHLSFKKGMRIIFEILFLPKNLSLNLFKRISLVFTMLSLSLWWFLVSCVIL